MSFKCEACGQVKRFPVKVVAAVRDSEYEILDKHGNIKRITKGTEIAKEMTLCRACAGEAERTNIKNIEHHDCNSCDRGSNCQGDFTFTGKRNNPIKVWVNNCWRGWKPPQGVFSLIEKALYHPESLNKCFLALPFKVKVSDYI